MKKHKIGIADDHVLFAEGISNILMSNNQLELVFVENSIPALKARLTNALVDLLILDINIPPNNGIDEISFFKKTYPQMKILILSMYKPEDLSLDLNTFLGDGYILKTSGKQVLENAVTAILNEEKYYDANVKWAEKTADSFTKMTVLSKREKEIIALITAGKTTKEIANHLFISELTVKTHRKNISEKLGSKGLADMIAKTRN